MDRVSPWPMIEVAQAVELINRFTSPLPSESVDVSESILGRTINQSVHATSPFPSLPLSIMDGYAVRASDCPGELNIVKSVRAGAMSQSTNQSSSTTDGQPKVTLIGPGECHYVTTGAPVLNGADAVCMIEQTEEGSKSDKVRIMASLKIGTNIRPIGCDYQQGQELISSGAVIGPIELGLLAAAGVRKVELRRVPRVAVMSSGDEVVDCFNPSLNPTIDHTNSQSVSGGDTVLQTGQIYDSNRPMLCALIKSQCNIDALDLGIVNDTDEQTIERLDQALTSGVDVLICSGGVSLGDRDRIKPNLDKLGVVHFGRIALKPGKPLTFATIDRSSNHKRPMLVFACPGNPVSSFVTTLLFAVPAIKQLSGLAVDSADYGLARVRAAIVGEWQRDESRLEFHRCIVTYDMKANKLIALSTGGQLSSRLQSINQANGLAIIAPGSETVNDGHLVDVLMFDKLRSFSKQELSMRIQVARHTKTTAGLHTCSHGHDHQAPRKSAMKQTNNQAGNQTTSHPSVQIASHSLHATPGVQWRCAVLTVSDRCSKGESDDQSGPALTELITKSGFGQVNATRCVPDEVDVIQTTLREWLSQDQPPHLIITTGGTGFAKRDVTPEAVSGLIERPASGLVHLLLSTSLRDSPMGKMTCLSRPVAGVAQNSLVITLPGSTNAVRECWDTLKDVLPHALQLLSD